jgi:hypothetical protein
VKIVFNFQSDGNNRWTIGARMWNGMEHIMNIPTHQVQNTVCRWTIGAHSSVAGWDTMLQARRSRVRVLMRWIFFNLPNPSSRTMTLGSTKPLTEMSTRNLPGGVKDSWRIRLTTLLPSVSRLSRDNMEALTSHNPMGLHGLLQG